MTEPTSTLTGALTEFPEYSTVLRQLICEAAIAGRLLPRSENWTEHQLDSIVSVRGGSTPPMTRTDFWGGDIPWVSPKDMRGGDIVTSEMFITKQALAETSIELVAVGSVLIVGRSGILKRKLPAQVTRVPCTINQDIKALTPSSAIESAYLRLWLLGQERSILAEDVKTGTTVQSLIFTKLFSRRVYLPPFAEQHRIVAKVDELMSLCDRLEARQADAQCAHARLVQALLDSLTQARDAEDFQAAWERVAGCFEGIFSTEESVTALANAMRRTIFSGRTSKTPEKWQSVNLKDVTCFLNGYAFKSEWFTQQGIRLARNTNISHGNINWADTAHIDFDRAEEFKNFSLQAGDILLSLDRPIISTGLKMAVVSEQDLPCMLLQRVAKITPAANKITADFLLHWLRSPFFIEAIDPGRSNGVPHISTKQVGNLELLLPPLEEQHRIVAKLDELLAMCDQLKARIAAARAKQAQLAEALVKQAVAAG